jgi:hypothetical protein
MHPRNMSTRFLSTLLRDGFAMTRSPINTAEKPCQRDNLALPYEMGRLPQSGNAVFLESA